jgi:hypothetical protein
LDREVEWEKVEVALNGEGKRDNHPAMVANNKDEAQNEKNTQQAKKGRSIATDGLAGQPRGKDEKAEGDESEANLLSGEVLHVL